MQKVAILTDSIASLPHGMAKKLHLRIVPINIHFNGHVYQDGVDITPARAYQLLEKAPEQFSSAPASIGEYVTAYREAAACAGSILCITLSSKLSTLYNIAFTAAEEARKQLPHTAIEVLDSRTAAVGEGLVVSAAAKAAAAGGDMAEVVEIAASVRDRVRVIGIMDTTRHVYRTGRVPRFAALAGSILSIRPIFTISDGVVHLAGLTRDKGQSIERALCSMRRRVSKQRIHVAVAHANVPEEGERLKGVIASEFDCAELWLTDFSPVMGYATGAGVLAIAYYPASAA